MRIGDRVYVRHTLGGNPTFYEESLTGELLTAYYGQTALTDAYSHGDHVVPEAVRSVRLRTLSGTYMLNRVHELRHERHGDPRYELIRSWQ